MHLLKTINKNMKHKRNNYFVVRFNMMSNCIFRSYNSIKNKKEGVDEDYMRKHIKEKIELR